MEKTKKKIKQALLSLLEKKRITDLSISEICKKAHVNRNTFYAHFATPEKVIDEIADDLTNEEFKLLRARRTTKEIVIAACEYTKAHANENRILLSNGGEKYFIEKSIEYSVKAPIYIINNDDNKLTSKQIEMVHTYIIHGAVAILKEWLYSGMKESPEEIGEMVDRISSSLIAGINRA